MNAQALYNKLNEDFVLDTMTDEWYKHMHELKEYVCDNFKKTSIGLVCDFATEINKVFTAVFPSNEVMQQLIDKDERDAMLFLHHAAEWDINKDPVWTQMDKDLLEEFRERNISIFVFHVPLDNFGEFSTSMTLTKALGLEPGKAFCEYHGALCGVISEVNSTLEELKISFEEAVGHEVIEYKYGSDKVSKVAIVAGGGNDMDTLAEMKALGADTLITGITALNDHSYEAHEFAKTHGINLIGGTHYSTEKFAMQAMENYFRDLGLDAEFVKGSPVEDDM